MAEGVARRLALVALLALAAGCGELPLPPQVEAAGEPGVPIYSAFGALQAVAFPARGQVTYVLDASGLAALSLSADFAVAAVPSVSIFLSNTPDLGRAVKVAALGGTTGPQRWTFQVPRGAVWSWAVLWSEELRVQVARAPLQPAG